MCFQLVAINENRVEKSRLVARFGFKLNIGGGEKCISKIVDDTAQKLSWSYLSWSMFKQNDQLDRL